MNALDRRFKLKVQHLQMRIEVSIFRFLHEFKNWMVNDLDVSKEGWVSRILMFALLLDRGVDIKDRK